MHISLKCLVFEIVYSHIDVDIFTGKLENNFAMNLSDLDLRMGLFAFPDLGIFSFPLPNSP